MPKKYMVELAQDERDELEAVLKSSTRRAVSVTKLQRARILLAVDQGGTGPALTDMQVVDALGVTERTCQHVRRRAVEQGPMKALERRPRPLPPVPKKLDGEKEARLVQVACSVPPEGRVRWTVKMLAEELARLEVVESICEEIVRKALKKNELNHVGGKCGVSLSNKATISWSAWSGCSRYTGGCTTRGIRWCAWTI